MGLPGLIRLAALALIGLGFLLGAGCATSHPALANETSLEGWARCDRTHPANFTVFCLEMRRPL